MRRQPFILATAGHVDHGKSSLVRALTGTDPDRLPEEKARGITIELGFAHFDLVDESTPPPVKHSIGVIDVPGHEDFVKNMVAGVGSIDLALLVVAADDGWMPQTEEHLQILSYLGVRRGVVALTKADLASDPAAVTEAVRSRLTGSPLADAPIVPTAAPTGAGIGELKAALLHVLRETPAPRDAGKPRLAVDRAFTLKGHGSVVTGTLAGGRLTVGAEVLVQPGERKTRIRSLQSHNSQLTEVQPGTRTAINLPDLPLAGAGADGIHRGDVVTLAGFGACSAVWNVLIRRSPRLRSDTPAGRNLRSDLEVQVHHGSACHRARLILLGQRELAAGGRCPAQLRFAVPAFAFAGEHFILRDAAERWTLAGGTVLLPDADRRKPHAPDHVRWLQRLSDAFAGPAAWIRTMLARRGWMSISEGNRTTFGAVELETAAAALVTAGEVHDAGAWLVARDAWERLLAASREAIVKFHAASPEKPGLPLTELRSVLATVPDEVFQAMLAGLERDAHVRQGSVIRSRAHRLELPPQLREAGDRIRRTLSEKPMEPPGRKELAPDAGAQTALRFLIQNGEAVDLGPELVLGTRAFNEAVAAVKSHLQQHGGATVSELRPVLGTTRRILIPLLEQLDRQRITLRQGDRRVLPG